MSGHESYDQETFVNTGWLLMKHLFSKFEKSNSDAGKNDSGDADDVAAEDDYDYDEDLDDVRDGDDDVLQAPKADVEDNDEDVEAGEHIEEPEKPVEAQASSKYTPEVQALVDAADAAREDFKTVDRSYNNLNR